MDMEDRRPAAAPFVDAERCTDGRKGRGFHAAILPRFNSDSSSNQ
jgi:hypothetical protein